MPTVKQRLEALERQIGISGDNPRNSPEYQAQRKRWGLSDYAGHPRYMPPEDMRKIGEIMDGKYPVTMTEADIEYARQIPAYLESLV
jgi:hypothetical protein